jgi:hypothetical protein
MASARRTSNFPTRMPGSQDRPDSRDTDKEEIWKPMLDNISSGKRLPEKSLLVLGEHRQEVQRSRANRREQAEHQRHSESS